MNVDELIDAIGDIDDDLILDSIQYKCLITIIISLAIISSISVTEPQGSNMLIVSSGMGEINAVVKETGDQSLVAECYECLSGDIEVNQKILINSEAFSYLVIPDLKIGDLVKIQYRTPVTDINGILQPKRIISVELIKGSTDR